MRFNWLPVLFFFFNSVAAISIENSYNVTVGTVVGNGVALLNTTTLCLPINTTITSITFTVPDFSVVLDTETIVPPLDLNVTVVNNNTYCANVSTSGTYYPILRYSAWQTYLGPSSSSTGASSSSSTAVSSSSSSSSSSSTGGSTSASSSSSSSSSNNSTSPVDSTTSTWEKNRIPLLIVLPIALVVVLFMCVFVNRMGFKRKTNYSPLSV